MFAHSVFPASVFFGGVFPPAVTDGEDVPPPGDDGGGGGAVTSSASGWGITARRMRAANLKRLEQIREEDAIILRAIKLFVEVRQ